MTNAEWCIKNGIQFKQVGHRPCSNPSCESIGYYDMNGNFNEGYKGTWLGRSLSESILIWLDMEHKESILDESERQYLSAVIKPFRDHVRYICKGVYESGTLEKKFQFIKISIGNSPYDLIMPGFAPYTIYQGMELNKEYTLKELGL